MTARLLGWIARSTTPVRVRMIALCSSLVAAAAAPAGALELAAVEELRRLSLEELVNLEITTVSRRPELLQDAAASVYVITSEEIRRSGANSLPEVLRLAPNLHIARQDARTYAVSARGFGTFLASNKLLVLIDGRSVYSPLHGGVFWDQQQVMLEDVERIEVISGPGGTLWGANAVNGVINVITRSAHGTLGGLVDGHLGNVDSGAAARYGVPRGERGAMRAYGQLFERGATRLPPGGERDRWRGRQAGFRLDLDGTRDSFTLQGDLFDNAGDLGRSRRGGNILGRWRRDLGRTSAVEVQAYYDRVARRDTATKDRLQTFDLQGQHNFAIGERHDIVWGAGLRIWEDTFTSITSPLAMTEPRRTIQLGNVFVQDSIGLRDNLTLTLGTKVEYSSYTGVDYLPNARLAWRASDTALLWGAVSRAVRTPSRLDRDLFSPGFLDPAPGFDSERLIAYELGYRGRPTPASSLSASLFYHDYDDLRALTINPETGLLRLDNVLEGRTYGIESWADYQLTDWWRLGAGGRLMRSRFRLRPGGLDMSLDQMRGNDPDIQVALRSHMDLPYGLELDLALRAVDRLPDPRVPGYVTADARLGWRPVEGLELSVAGFNLFGGHAETGPPATRREVRRSVHVGARWRF
jgi:iron complex outermembrane recepter protein